MVRAQQVEPARTFRHLGRSFKVDFAPCTNGHWTLTASSVEYFGPGIIGQQRRYLVLESEDPDSTFLLLKTEVCRNLSR